MAIWRLRTVQEKTGLSRSAIYRLMAAGCFPRQASLGGVHTVGWSSAEVEQWMRERLQARQSSDVQ